MKKKSFQYKVDENGDLIKYLVGMGLGKNKIKTYVKLGYIYVNEVLVAKLPFLISKGDIIEIRIEANVKDKFEIIYEDSNYLIVNKENGLLTISTSNQEKNIEDTLYRRVREYLNQKKEYAFIVNRIDKETSGIVVFAKNLKLKEQLQEHWNDIVKRRGYIAVVSGVIKKQGRIDNYLYEDKMTFSHSTKYGGKRAITNYKPIKNHSKYTMLDVWIETGRKNQIRVHMSELGYPIVGDKKYHSKDNSLKRLCLHHYEISLIDPISGKLLRFTSEVPREFYRLFH